MRTATFAAVVVYAAAAAVGILLTANPAETFRHAPRIGFHDQEAGPGGPFRWTRRRFALWLEPGQTRRLVLAHFPPSSRPADLDAVLDGRTVYRRTLKPGETVQLLLSGAPAVPRALLFRVSEAFVPKRLGLSQDRRELALLSIEPR